MLDQLLIDTLPLVGFWGGAILFVLLIDFLKESFYGTRETDDHARGKGL